MKKSRIIILVCLIVFVLFAVGDFLFFYSIRQVNWWAKPSVNPITYESEWFSEDGMLSFGTFERNGTFEQTMPDGRVMTVLGADSPKGFISVGTEKIPIYITLGHDGSLWILLDDKPYVPNQKYETLEKWEAIKYKETETEVVITLRVKETTYFTEGQKVKLIHKKAS